MDGGQSTREADSVPEGWQVYLPTSKPGGIAEGLWASGAWRSFAPARAEWDPLEFSEGEAVLRFSCGLGSKQNGSKRAVEEAPSGEACATR